MAMDIEVLDNDQIVVLRSQLPYDGINDSAKGFSFLLDLISRHDKPIYGLWVPPAELEFGDTIGALGNVKTCRPSSVNGCARS